MKISYLKKIRTGATN